jgi:UDP-GlcNAc:undecaprenyl-phosphate GlcNAc-1-phosphate transferase
MNAVFNNSLFLITIIAMPIVVFVMRILALKIDLVDVPNYRKIHRDPIPLAGGLALFVMAVLLLFLTNNIDSFSFSLIIGATLVLTIGLLDDLFQLSALWRFSIQISASLIVIFYSGVKLFTFGELLIPNLDLQLGLLSIPITVFGVVGVINAINMADGIDGLAAMVFFSPVLAMVLLSPQTEMTLWLSLLLICLLIFVVFNKSSKLKVFLGDNGSMLLGFILAWLLVYFSQGHTQTIKPVTALYLVAIPIYDTIFVMLRRIVNKISPFKPDNTHLHHLFLKVGYSQTHALLMVVFLHVIFILLGILFLKYQMAEYLQFYLFVLMSIIYYILMHKIWKKNQS